MTCSGSQRARYVTHADVAYLGLLVKSKAANSSNSSNQPTTTFLGLFHMHKVFRKILIGGSRLNVSNEPFRFTPVSQSLPSSFTRSSPKSYPSLTASGQGADYTPTATINRKDKESKALGLGVMSSVLANDLAQGGFPSAPLIGRAVSNSTHRDAGLSAPAHSLDKARETVIMAVHSALGFPFSK
ncbi:hypothetical protein ElyMa_004283700 [Elysia marginata]|uniref:Uncharacterized protein n=1 Tax=Elysia marginata TaxID=1093978 RepID=A0AAV4GWX3_9GAST|nr:hypothetical protein ElyMa_004283700 [Elysia marginata]